VLWTGLSLDGYDSSNCRSHYDFWRDAIVGWAAHYIARLQSGETVSFRPRGHSMSGKIDSGQLCTVEPVEAAAVKVGDIVLCRVRGREYLHIVKAIQGPRFQIGNNRGHINGWVTGGSIFGRCIKIEE
jgi:hypothetical protein